MIDAKAFGAELAGIVKTVTAPLLARIDALEKAISDMPAPRDGKDADPTEVAALVAEQAKAEMKELRSAIAALPSELPDIAAMVKDQVKVAVTSIPAPESGRAGSDGKDGASVLLDDVLPALQRQVDEYLAGLPVRKDGKDGADGKDGEPGQPGEKGADGIGLAGALIDRDGNLVVTLTNGETKALGAVVGKDGTAGENGRPGRDGIGFDDMTLDYDGERTFTFLFQRGERIEERKFVVPVMLDRGVYRSEATYAKGDSVTYGGSVWIAQTNTKARPDGSADWRLAVKKGRDGKDGVMKAAEGRAPLKVGAGHAD